MWPRRSHSSLKVAFIVFALSPLGSGQVNTVIARPPSVDVSSEVVYMKATRTLFINGANFNLGRSGINKLYFDPPLLLDWEKSEVGDDAVSIAPCEGSSVWCWYTQPFFVVVANMSLVP